MVREVTIAIDRRAATLVLAAAVVFALAVAAAVLLLPRQPRFDFANAGSASGVLIDRRTGATCLVVAGEPRQWHDPKPAGD